MPTVYTPPTQHCRHQPIHNQPSTPQLGGGGAPQNRPTPPTNPHTPTNHFSPYIHDLNPQPPDYTANSPHRQTTGDQNTHTTNTTYMASNLGWPQTGQQQQSRAANPSQPVQPHNQIPTNFISQTFPNIQPQSRPNALSSHPSYLTITNDH